MFMIDVSKMIFPIKRMNKMFTDKRFFIGGSFAQSFFFKKDNFKYNDIDVFIVGDRNFETTAMKDILSLYFDEVTLPYKKPEPEKVPYIVNGKVILINEEIEDPYYGRIENQFALFKCKKDGIKYDLIFIRKDDNIDAAEQVTNIMGSTLSEIIYEYNHYKPFDDRWSLVKNDNRDRNLSNGKCVVYTNANTPTQLMKLIVRTSSLNLSIDVKSRGMK